VPESGQREIFSFWHDGYIAERKRGSALDRALANKKSLSRTGLRSCPPPTPVFTGRKDVLSQMHAYFSANVGRRHVFVLHGLGGSGKSQIAFKFVEECQVDAETSQCAAYVRQIHILATDTFHSCLSKVFGSLFRWRHHGRNDHCRPQKHCCNQRNRRLGERYPRLAIQTTRRVVAPV